MVFEGESGMGYSFPSRPAIIRPISQAHPNSGYLGYPACSLVFCTSQPKPLYLICLIRLEVGFFVVGTYARYTLQTLQQLWVLMCEVKAIRQLRAADCCSVIFLLRWF